MWHTTVGFIVLLTLGVLGVPRAAAQQQTQTMPRIGVLTSGSLASDAAWIEAFRQGCASWDTVEGHSIGISKPACLPVRGRTKPGVARRQAA